MINSRASLLFLLQQHRRVILGAGLVAALLFLVGLITSKVREAYAAESRSSDWRILGPGGGGAMFFPTISPHDPNTVLVRCDMTGSYLSHDAGRSWRMFNLGMPSQFFVFDPVDPKVIYVKAAGLWRSADGGLTWKLVHPDPANVRGKIMPDDHAGEIIVTRDGKTNTVTALAVDPSDSKTLFAVMSDRQTAALYVSKDWGKRWIAAGDLPNGGQKIFVDPRSPRADRTLSVVGHNAVSLRKGGQWSHGQPPAGISGFTDVSAGIPSGAEMMILYATAPMKRSQAGIAGGVLVSRDGGMNWKQVTDNVAGKLDSSSRLPEFPSVATCWTHPEVTYLSYDQVALEPGKSNRYFGVLKTTDGGQTWNPVRKEASTPDPNMHDAWITELFGPGWGSNPISIGVAPQNSEICYTTDYGRTMQSTNGGRNWVAVYSQKTPQGAYQTTGLDVTTAYGVHFDPFNKNRIYISYTDMGGFLSEDGGSSWFSATKGVPRPWVNTTYWVVFDPEVKGRAWGVMSGIHDLPRPKMWRRQSPAKYNGGVCISGDGGKTWSQSIEGMPPTAATHILLDPKSPVNARVLYVAGYGRGVFKSIDGGKHWTLKNDGIQGTEPFAWRLIQDRNGVLYLVVARRSDDGSIGNEQDGALYRSSDGAEHWEKLQLPEGVNGPNGLAIDPDDPNRFCLAVWGRRDREGAVAGGIYLSADGGKSWRRVLSRDQHVYDVTIDPRNPRRLYACGFESSAWRSDDRGETWKRIRGYNFKWGHRVIPDPQDPDKIYITTFGGSVWHGPAAGDLNATEDIVTPELSYNR